MIRRRSDEEAIPQLEGFAAKGTNSLLGLPSVPYEGLACGGA